MNTRKPPLGNILHFFGVMVTRGLVDMVMPLRKGVAEAIHIRSDECRVWMVGHATVLINFYGTTILTDPVLVNWLPYPRRRVAAAYTPEELPSLDIVLISHAHIDHLNRTTLKYLASQTKIIVLPRFCEDLVSGLGFANVVTLDWNESCAASSVDITAIRPEHWGERYPWEHRGRRFHAYVLRKRGVTIFFAGDTAYGSYFRDVGHSYEITLSILPIGCYHPQRYYAIEHMSPEQALQAFLDLNATFLIPMHWGSFRFTREPLEEPPQRLIETALAHGVAERIRVLRNGQSATIAAS